MNFAALVRRLPGLVNFGPEFSALVLTLASLVRLLSWRNGVPVEPNPFLGTHPALPEAAALFALAGATLLLLLQRGNSHLQFAFALLVVGSGVDALLSSVFHLPYFVRPVVRHLIGIRVRGDLPNLSVVASSVFCLLGFAFLVLLRSRITALQRLCVAVSSTLLLSVGVISLFNSWFSVKSPDSYLFTAHTAQVPAEMAVYICLAGFGLAAAAKRRLQTSAAGGSANLVITNHLLVSLTLLLLFTGVNAVLGLGLDESAKEKINLARTYQMENAIDEAVAGLREAESGQRAYLFTGQELFLAAYRTGLDRSAKARQVISGDPLDESSSAFTELLQTKTSELAETIRLQQEGQSKQAKRLVAGGPGLRSMRLIEEQAQTYRAKLSSLLETENAGYRRATELVRRSILASYAMALCLLACAALFFKREIQARVLVEDKLRVHEAELAVGVERKTRELQVSEARYQAMLDQSPLAIHVLDSHGNSQHVNAAFERMVGIPAEQMQGYNIWKDPQPDAQGTRELLRRAFNGETGLTGTVSHNPKLSSGTPLGSSGAKLIWAEVIAYPVKSSSGHVAEVVLLCQDVTDRQIALFDLRESEMKFRHLANVLPQVVWTAKPDGVLDYFNDRWWALTQSSPELGMGWDSAIHPDDLPGFAATWERSLASSVSFQFEVRLKDCGLDVYRWFLARAVPVFNENGTLKHWVGTTTDIQNQKAAEEELELRVSARTNELLETNKLLRSREDELQRSLDERDILFRELHHRVKNNLQVISSLLRMKGSAVKHEPAAFSALEESRRRVLSMSMIYERLYTKESINDIDFADYTTKLVDELMYSYSLPGCSVTSRMQLQPVRLPVDQAIPCGLILNELVTNALKYAFVGRLSGEVRVTLQQEAGLIHLSVCDDGVGLPAGVDWEKAKTLGLPIVHILARQLDGTITSLPGGGAGFTITFQASTQQPGHGPGVY